MALLTTSLVTVVEDDNLGEVPSSLKEELAKLASQRMPSGVLMYWYQLIKGQGEPSLRPHDHNPASRSHSGLKRLTERL